MHQMGAGDEHLWNMGARNILMGRRSFGSSIFLRLSPFSVGILRGPAWGIRGFREVGARRVPACVVPCHGALMFGFGDAGLC